MFEKLRRIRNERNISALEMAKLLGLKTAAAYYKKRKWHYKFHSRRGKEGSGLSKNAYRRNFFKEIVSKMETVSNK